MRNENPQKTNIVLEREKKEKPTQVEVSCYNLLVVVVNFLGPN